MPFCFFITFCSRCCMKWDTACRPTNDPFLSFFITYCWWILVGQVNARVKKLHARENFLEINRHFAFTSYCNTIGQSNNAFSILGFSWRENEEALF